MKGQGLCKIYFHLVKCKERKLKIGVFSCFDSLEH